MQRPRKLRLGRTAPHEICLILQSSFLLHPHPHAPFLLTPTPSPLPRAEETNLAALAALAPGVATTINLVPEVLAQKAPVCVCSAVEAAPTAANEEHAVPVSLPTQKIDWLSMYQPLKAKGVTLTRKRRSFASRLRRDVSINSAQVLKDEGEVTAELLAFWLAPDHRLSVLRSGVSGGAAPSSQPGDEFLLVQGADEAEGVTFIVAVGFRQLMMIRQPSKR